MENLFLEILRVIDLKVHQKNTEFYYFTIHYFKLTLANKVNNENLLEIYNKIPNDSISLFSASKKNVDTEILKNINFDYSNVFFYKGREILFFICYFINFLLKKPCNDLKIEKDFFNLEDNYDLISTFNLFLKHSDNKKPIIDIYNNIDNLSINYKKIVEDSFQNQKSFEFKNFNMKDLKKKIYIDFKNAILLYLNYNKLEVGIKELNYHTFETQIFYIMFSILSSEISSINLSKMYLEIQKI